jgi:hypothetical protein
MTLLFEGLTLSSRRQAVTPVPDGVYPDGTTAERGSGLFGSQSGPRQAGGCNQAEKTDKTLVTKGIQQTP